MLPNITKTRVRNASVCVAILLCGLITWITLLSLHAQREGTASSAEDNVPATANQPRMAFVTYPTEMNARVSDRFEEVILMDQDGDFRHFYSDLVADRAVCIVFFYTRCTGSCPTTIQTIKKLKDRLDLIFRDDELKFIALTLEPDVDRPEQLRAYMQNSGIADDPEQSEWLFATADFEALERLRFSLGVYDLDPKIDADKTEHASLLTFGNDRTNRWAALPADMDFEQLLTAMRKVMGNDSRQAFGRFANATLQSKTPDAPTN